MGGERRLVGRSTPREALCAPLDTGGRRQGQGQGGKRQKAKGKRHRTAVVPGTPACPVPGVRVFCRRAARARASCRRADTGGGVPGVRVAASPPGATRRGELTNRARRGALAVLCAWRGRGSASGATAACALRASCACEESRAQKIMYVRWRYRTVDRLRVKQTL